MPIQVGLVVPPAAAPAPVPAAPTAVLVLLQIASTPGPWFPGRFAAESGTSRDSLDEPLSELRLAGLVLATEWVRGVGQGFALTPAGKITVADAGALERLSQGVPASAVAAQAAPAEEDATAEPADLGHPAVGVEDGATRPPVVVPALLMANAVWFFICAVWGIRWGLTLSRSLSEGHPEVLHRFGAVSGMDLLAGEWWRLFTCCFVHVGALHLLGNLFALAMMGPLAELLWGRWRLLLIYTISGLAGSALAMALQPNALLAGASGAIWGVQMSLFVWLHTFRDRLPTDVAADWFRRLMVVFLLNGAVSFLPNVSWEGHLGGGLAGLLTAGLLNAARFGDRPRRLGAWMLLTMLPALCVAGVAGAMGAEGLPGWRKLRQQLAAERSVTEGGERLAAAHETYARQIGPRLARLMPADPNGITRSRTLVKLLPEERELLALRRSPDAPPQQRAAARAKVLALKAVAEEVAAATPRESVGAPPLDKQFARVGRFATAQAAALEWLLALDGSGGLARSLVWAAWANARMESHQLWLELTK
ncbi:rhomboid family intramembrane serine protease [Gemmata sp. JC673]|uniref:Rhomboid family intramembrane serine protease n=1 Tax=Gemmata algarum TaxID=2975278 RepID=A0ABU5ES29_9BACT|nr:rhomboid family intramembrane serine protease [Gemmata algarum]MDY3557783.1 rhomboid family intramembrane serine protease [Gemmata algarum]